MPKFRIAETVRVEFFTDADSLDKAMKEYLDEFILTFNSKRKVNAIESTDFTTMRLDNSEWVEIDYTDYDKPDNSD